MPIKTRFLFYGVMLDELPLLMPLMVCALFLGALQAVVDGARQLREQLLELALPRLGRRLMRTAPRRG